MKICNGCQIEIQDNLKVVNVKNYQLPWCAPCNTQRRRDYNNNVPKDCIVCKKNGYWLKGKSICSWECRLKSKVTHITENQCWECNDSAMQADGYPVMYIKNKATAIHRVFYEHYKGKIENNHAIIKTCNNSVCVNPDHLDMVTSSTLGKKGASKVTHYPQKKYSKEDMKNIYDMFTVKKMRQDDIGKLYNTSGPAIESIIGRYRNENNCYKCIICNKNTSFLIGAYKKMKLVCSIRCRYEYTYGIDIIKDILLKKNEHNWETINISKHYQIDPKSIRNILKLDWFSEIENYDICANCSKQHDNLGSQYCSTQCMTQYLTKE